MEKSNQPRRLEFGHFVDRVFWAIISGALIWGSVQLQELNVKVAVLISQSTSTEKKDVVQDEKIDFLYQHCIFKR